MKKIVYSIAKRFKEKLGSNLLSVSIHGGYAQEDINKDSDIDFFLILKKIDIGILKKVRDLKEKFEKEYGKKLSVNIQKESELPKIRKKAFFHKNRYALFLHEANKIDKTIIGKNPYKINTLPSHEEIRLEAIRIINSFAYFLRKFIVNSNLDFAVKEAIRYVIIATQYANAFIGYYPLKTKDSVEEFENNFADFKLNRLPLEFRRIKRGERKIIDKKDILNNAVSFLESLDEYIFSKFN